MGQGKDRGVLFGKHGMAFRLAFLRRGIREQ